MALARRMAIFGGAALALLPLAARAQSALAGVYAAAGMNPDGSKYKGSVRITEQDGIFSLF